MLRDLVVSQVVSMYTVISARKGMVTTVMFECLHSQVPYNLNTLHLPLHCIHC
jgi:hypothetical protein